MKVLLINATYGYSSTGLIIKDIGEMVSKNGGEAFYAYQSCNETPKNGYCVGNKLDWKFHALFCRLSGKQGYYSKFATKKLIKHIESIKPDIIHLHNLHSNYINLNLLLKYIGEKDIATIITFHDCWYFTGKCFHYVDIGCEGFKNGCGNCPKKNAPPKSLFFDPSAKVLKDRYKYLSGIPRLMICGSSWVCGEARKGILKDCKITKIYNGVNVDIFKPYEVDYLREKHQLKDDTYVVMGMANKWLLPSNQQLLKDTIKILNDKMKLLIIGCREDQIASLRELSDHIIPVGFIRDRVELAKYYNLANVFVNATHADTLPTVNMESICCGTPVITYDSCGSPELVLDGCGKIVNDYDAEKLIEAISEKLGKIEGSKLINARLEFDKNECYKKYLDIYKSVSENEK